MIGRAPAATLCPDTPLSGTDDAPGTATVTLNATANVQEGDTLTAGTPLTITPTEGTAFTGTLGTFTSSYAANTASDFTATITWGDGATTTGVVTGGNGTFTVSAVGTAHVPTPV